MSIIDEILSGHPMCPGKVSHFVGTMMLDHLRMHETGECKKKPKHGRIHLGDAPESQRALALDHMKEARELCTCGEHR